MHYDYEYNLFTSSCVFATAGSVDQSNSDFAMTDVEVPSLTNSIAETDQPLSAGLKEDMGDGL
jgi:hypothetical protein